MKFSLRMRPSLAALSLGALAVLATALASWVGVPLLDLLELRSYDLRFQARGAQAPSGLVVLAVVDERSLDREGRWPWPRSRLAALVDALSRDGARAIGFDIGFIEAEEAAELRFIDRLRARLAALGLEDARLTAFLDETRARADQDGALAQAIEAASAPVVLGYFFHMPGDDDDPGAALGLGDPAQRAARFARIRSSQYPVVLEPASGNRPPLPTALAAEPNLERLSAVAAGAGAFNLRPDEDGVVRWMPLVFQLDDALFPPLALSLAWHALGEPPLRVVLGSHGVESLEMGDRRIPTDPYGRLLIDYRGPARSFPQVPIGDVLAGEVPPDTFRDRIVLVGVTATGLFDARVTPFGQVFPGPEIQATVVDDLLTGDFLSKPWWTPLFDLVAIVLAGGAVALAATRAGALGGLVVALGVGALQVLLARWLFDRHGIWIGVVYPILGVAVAYVSLTLHAYLREARERREVRRAFGRYVSPEVIETMLSDPSRLELGGDEKVLTVLFSDLDGFTSHSERHTPQQMIGLLSEYYALMTEQIFAQGGMLKEYVGDELMAIFGAPVPQADHAARACATALAMQRARTALAEEWTRTGRPPLRARTGINSGPMLVGNLGSKYRFSYGVLGDDTNLGSRLEGLNKSYGTEILVGDKTVALLDGGFRLREVDQVRVVGRRTPTRVYELVGLADESLAPEHEALLTDYATALAAYRKRSFDEAQRGFQACLALRPDDGPSRVMAERCGALQAAPPAEDWDAVYEVQRK